MADNDVEGPIVALDASTAGWLLKPTPTGVGSAMRFERIDAATVGQQLALAQTALQPGAVGEAGALSLAELDERIAAATGDLETLLAAILGPQG